MSRARRLAAVEQAQRARLDRMSEGELMASLDAQYGEGTGAFFSAYFDAMSLDQLEQLLAGDLALRALAWEAFDRWQEHKR